MTPDGPRARTRRRRLRQAILAAALVAAQAAAAQEPLHLRIRPRPEADAETALAAREALWARRQAHARAVVASVCAGCLRSWEPAPATAKAAERIAALAGLETDPVPGASGPPPDPAILQPLGPQERP